MSFVLLAPFPRRRWEGKVGFMDRSLTVKIPPAWDFAFPFEDGKALEIVPVEFDETTLPSPKSTEQRQGNTARRE